MTPWIRPRWRKRNGTTAGGGVGGDNDDGEERSRSTQKNWTRSLPPSIVATGTHTTMLGALLNWRLTLRFLVGATVTLYVLNQKHLLPKQLSSVVSKVLFWPTLPVTVSSRVGRWMTNIDDAVVMGGAPFALLGMPDRLYYDYGVRGVINMCDEYRGPTAQYERLGMKELWLRTVDHFEPSVSDLKRAVAFIKDTERKSGGRVYIHCRAGHGRSAAAVFAWLLYKKPDQDPEELNAWLVKKRNVRKALWKQPNIKKFYSWIRNQEALHGNDFEKKHDIAADIWKLDEADGETEEDTWIDTTSDYACDTSSEEDEAKLSSEQK